MSGVDSKRESYGLRYYGWVVVGVSLLNILVFYGIWYSYSVFLVALAKEYSWSYARASSVFSLFMIVVSFSGPFVGLVLDKMTPKYVLPLGAFVLCAGLVICSRATSIDGLYVGFGLIVGIGGSALGLVGNSVSIASWFVEKRGLAIGIVTTGMGLGMVLFVPAIQLLEPIHGWRTTFLYLSALSALLIPINFFFQKIPKAVKLGPYVPFWRNSQLKKVVRSRPFLYILFIFFAAGLVVQAILMHQVAIARDAKFESVTIAAAFGLLGLLGIVGRPLWGILSDRMGRKKAYMMASAIFLLGVFFIYLSKRYHCALLLYTYSFLFGIGYSALAPLNWTIAADHYAGDSFGSLYGILFMGTGFGAATGPLLSGFLYDRLSDYAPVYALVAIFVFLTNLALVKIYATPLLSKIT